MELPSEPLVQPSSLTIVVAEPDGSELQVLQSFLRARSHRVIGLGSLADLFDTLDACKPDCMIVSFDVVDADAIRTLADKHPQIPILAVAHAPDLDTVVKTIKSGAADFLAKPYDVQQVIERAESLAEKAPGEQAVSAPDQAPQSFRMLTGREHEVLVEIAGGASSKEVGRRLGISPRTVDVHRARIKEKLQVRRAVDLVRLVYDAKGSVAKG